MALRNYNEVVMVIAACVEAGAVIVIPDSAGELILTVIGGKLVVGTALEIKSFLALRKAGKSEVADLTLKALGNDVYALTSKGTEPAWSTVRARFWKSEAAQPGAAEKYGAENIERMAAGKAPQRYNADKGGIESMELSHEPVPQRAGGRDFVPRWPQDHAAVDPFRRPGY